MLVLTRQIQESIVIGNADCLAYALKVTVLEVSGGEVRLGFEAPTQIVVHRLELWERLAKQAAGCARMAAAPPGAAAVATLSTPMPRTNGVALPPSNHAQAS